MFVGSSWPHFLYLQRPLPFTPPLQPTPTLVCSLKHQFPSGRPLGELPLCTEDPGHAAPAPVQMGGSRPRSCHSPSTRVAAPKPCTGMTRSCVGLFSSEHLLESSDSCFEVSLYLICT